ncbi:MAG TPA: GNAT family N-acetyltransferase [Candidatus Paceibacterota bacterium]|nr:GNAT family N-acetyltransferase [Verrucomicrobiota bacterium]HRY50710.1 GNAT family N-acetyltransferase [Candidatus Paceibacterota bacterium]
MKSDHKIRPFEARDAAGVSEVLKAVYHEKAPSMNAYNWWSFGCPESTSGFMVAEVEDQLVGVQPMEIMSYKDGSRNTKGGLLTGVAVHPDYRRRGIFSDLVRACEQEAWRQNAAFVTTMPNERSRPGFLKMGYIDLGCRQLLLRPLAPRAIAKKKLSIPLIASLIGFSAAFAQGIVKPLSHDGDLPVTETSDLEGMVAQLEESTASLFPGLRVRRTPSWWRWRYLQSPARDYSIFTATTKKGQPAGLAAVATETRDGLSTAYLMDIAVNALESLPPLVRKILEVLSQRGVELFCAVTSSDAMSRALRRTGFWQVPTWVPVKRFYTVAKFNPAVETQIAPQWRKMSGWYQMLGDWDNV